MSTRKHTYYIITIHLECGQNQVVKVHKNMEKKRLEEQTVNFTVQMWGNVDGIFKPIDVPLHTLTVPYTIEKVYEVKTVTKELISTTKTE